MNDEILKFLAISNSGGGSSSQPNIQELNITQNGTYEAQGNVDGYNPVIVNVSGGDPEPPADGKTRLYITVPANSMPGLPPPRNEVPLYISQTVANGVTIDWGDGSDPETLPGTGYVNTTHTYQTAGDFVITLDPAEGCELGFGDTDNKLSIFGTTYGSAYYKYGSLPNQAVVGSRGINNISNSALCYCSSLRKVIILNGATSIEENAFNSCHALTYVDIPESVTVIKGYSFQNCYSLRSIKFCSNITKIDSRAFFNNYSIEEIHCLSNNPPVISSDTFSGIPSDCIIYVPVGSLEAYQTATNWSTYADQMQEEGN